MIHAVELPALDGRSPLGFLAALGLLNVLSAQKTGPVSLAFSSESASAVIYSRFESLDDMAGALSSLVASAEKETAILGVSGLFPLRAGKNADPMRRARGKYRDLTKEIAAIDTRAAEHWLPYLVTDLAVDKQGRAEITPFHAPRGKQNMRTFFQKSLEQVHDNPGRLSEALAGWTRVTDCTGEYFDHHVINSAADDPGGESVERGVPGATWLATMALPLLRVTGDGRNVAATLWHHIGDRFLMIWPLWRRPLDVPGAQVMIEHPSLVPIDSKPTVRRVSWAVLGIFAAYGAQRQLIPGSKFAGVLAPITIAVGD